MSTPRISGRRSAILPTLIVAAVLVVAFAIFTSFWTDRLWYQSMDFQTVFTTMLLTRIGLFATFGLVMAALVGGNAVLAYRLRSTTRLGPPTSPLLERYRELLDARLVWVVLAAAVLVGMAFGFGWTPCIGPVLGAVLAVTAATPNAHGTALLAAYAAGLGVPFLLAAFYLPFLLARLRRFSRAGRVVQVGAGGVMVAMGVALMTGNLTVVAGWIMQAVPGLAQLG